MPELEEAIANAPLWAKMIRLEIANPNPVPESVFNDSLKNSRVVGGLTRFLSDRERVINHNKHLRSIPLR
jgi:hypothetical protein